MLRNTTLRATFATGLNGSWPSDGFKDHETPREDSSVRCVTRRSTRVSDAKKRKSTTTTTTTKTRTTWRRWQIKRSKFISTRRPLDGDNDQSSKLKSGRKVLLGWRRDGHWAALGLTPTLGAHPHTSRGGVGVLKSPSGFRAMCTRRPRVYGWSADPCACVTRVYRPRCACAAERTREAWMLEGSDAKTETVRGLLLPSPMTVRVSEWGFGLPQLSAL